MPAPTPIDSNHIDAAPAALFNASAGVVCSGSVFDANSFSQTVWNIDRKVENPAISIVPRRQARFVPGPPQFSPSEGASACGIQSAGGRHTRASGLTVFSESNSKSAAREKLKKATGHDRKQSYPGAHRGFSERN